MVWLGISWEGKTKLVFVPEGVKVRAKEYLNNILEPVVKPLGQSLFHGQQWTFIQDSAPAHGAKVVQKWLRDNVPDFVSSQE